MILRISGRRGALMARRNNLRPDGEPWCDCGCAFDDDDDQEDDFWTSYYLDRMKVDPSYMPPRYDPQVDRAEVMRVLEQMVARQG